MARNLIICCDGTNNQFGTNNTNVVRLVQVLDRDPAKQLVYYDPGVGTMPEVGFVTPLGKWISKVLGLAFGAGLSTKIGEAYQFLMDNFQPGDKVFLFGFSRGSYTVRALAGVLNQFGLLPAGDYNLIPYVLRYSKQICRLDHATDEKKQAYWKFCSSFRETFARINVQDTKAVRSITVHFLGIWDTVSSVGWVWEPVHFPFTAYNPRVKIVRHAISLDEHRAFFRQNRWLKPAADTVQDVKELWFPGVHSDVGGGYPESEGALWRRPFLWMLTESAKAGLLIRPSKVLRVIERTPTKGPSWASRQHESLDWKWWAAEFFPKIRTDLKTGRKYLYVNFFRRRNVQPGAELHWSLLRRIRCSNLKYEPPNLTQAFRTRVKNLQSVPDSLPYNPD